MVKTLYDISEFETTDFDGLKLRYKVIDNEVMYLVTDFAKQYNDKYGTNKLVQKYIGNGYVKNFLEHCCDDKNMIKAATSRYYSRIKVPGYIYFITYTDKTKFTDICNGYIVCEQLLYDILIWINQDFKWKIFEYLKDIHYVTSDKVRMKNICDTDNNVEDKSINDDSKTIETLNSSISNYLLMIDHQTKLINDKEIEIQDLKTKNEKLSASIDKLMREISKVWSDN